MLSTRLIASSPRNQSAGFPTLKTALLDAGIRARETCTGTVYDNGLTAYPTPPLNEKFFDPYKTHPLSVHPTLGALEPFSFQAKRAWNKWITAEGRLPEPQSLLQRFDRFSLATVNSVAQAIARKTGIQPVAVGNVATAIGSVGAAVGLSAAFADMPLPSLILGAAYSGLAVLDIATAWVSQQFPEFWMIRQAKLSGFNGVMTGLGLALLPISLATGDPLLFGVASYYSGDSLGRYFSTSQGLLEGQTKP